jgi:hypothetical protein
MAVLSATLGGDGGAWPGDRVDRRLVAVQESIYFAFVSGLTIGYGDFAPNTFATRALAIVIGICGVLPGRPGGSDRRQGV